MQFEKDHIYHIYNQGNNRQKIFFDRENYLFFLQKMNDYLLPYCDIMAWCLMPNHFHWMVYVREAELIDELIDRGILSEPTDRLTQSELIDRVTQSELIDRVTQSHPIIHQIKPIDREIQSHLISHRTLNQNIAIILRSYTRAINQQRKTTGSLFRQKTKADCITLPQEISPSYYNLGFGTSIRLHDPQKEYPQVCFNYIHQNPVKAGLVKHSEDWEFSSFRDICGLRNGKLISKKRIDEFGLNPTDRVTQSHPTNTKSPDQ